MASNKSLNTAMNWLRDRHLECIICSERYNEPKALDCMHSFCQGCLLDYYKDSQAKPCPVCDKLTQLPEEGVRGLKTNFFINSLLADLSTLNTVDSSSDKQSEDEVKCEKHRECLKVFCMPCLKLICRKCADLDHPKSGGHRIIDYANAALELRISLQDVFPDRKRDIEVCRQSLQESSKARQHLHERVAMAISAVHAKAAEVIAQVKSEEERMCNDIKTLKRDRNTRFDEHEETVTKMLQEKQYTLEIAEDVVKNCSDSTFLDMYPDMTSMTSSQPVPQIDRCLSQLTFEQSKTIDVDLGSFDKLQPVEEGKLQPVGEGKLQPVGEGKLQPVGEGKLQPVGEGKMQPVGEGKLQPVEEGKLQPVGEGKLQPGSEGKWKLCHEFNNYPVITSMAALAHSDELALIAHINRRAIIINDTAGTFISSFKVPDGAFDIAEVEDKLVVVDTDRVKVYNRDGTLSFDFCTLPDYVDQSIPVSLRGIAVRKKGTIIVGDLKNASISEHFSDGSILSFIFMNSKMQPYSLAVDSKDRIVVGDRGSKVVVIDDNGDPLITIKPFIGGNKVQCLSLFCDGSGIYITVSIEIGDDRWSHIHQYDTEGRFLNCIINDIRCPLAITSTSDGQRLALADALSIKIYHKV